jgi:hypothetical protein
MSPTQTPPVHYQHPRRLVWVSTLRPSPRVEGFGCREYSFEAHLWLARVPATACPGHRRLGGSYVRCDLPVRLHACSPPRLAATQLARSSVRNRLIALAGLSPALTPASRAHQLLNIDSAEKPPVLVRKYSQMPKHSPPTKRKRWRPFMAQKS